MTEMHNTVNGGRRRHRVLWVMVGLLLAATQVATAHAAPLEDTTPPQLVGMSLSPTSVDTSQTAAFITVTLHVTDNRAGFGGYATLRLESPSGRQSVTVTGFLRVSGTPRDGVYEKTFALPEFSEQGTWTVTSLTLEDLANNENRLSTAELAAAGFPTTVSQTGDRQDVTPPTLVGLSFSPTSVDTSTNAAFITVTLHVTDNRAGFGGYGILRLKSPSGRQSVTVTGFERVSGTPRDGVYEKTFALPEFAEQGTWTVTSLTLVDLANNQRRLNTAELAAAGFPTTVTQTGDRQDTAPPKLVGLSFSPTSVNTSTNAAFITVTLHVTDNRAGFGGYGILRLESPSGQQSLTVTGFDRVSGTPRDGVYEKTFALPELSEQGTWTVTSLTLVDLATNQRRLSTTALASAGFPTTIQNGAP